MQEKLTPDKVLEEIEAGIKAEIDHLKKRKKQGVSQEQISRYKRILSINLFNYFSQGPTHAHKNRLSKRMNKFLQELATSEEEEKYQSLFSALNKEEILTIAFSLIPMFKGLKS